MGKKQNKQRADGRYEVSFKGKRFYGKSYNEACSKRDSYKDRLERGADPARERVSDYAADWLPINRHDVAPKTYSLYESFVRLLSACLDEKALAEVKPSDIKRIYTLKFKNASDSHIRHFKNLITAIFDSAVEDGYCMFNPVRSKKAAPHKGTAGTHRQLEQWERDLIQSTDARCRPLAMTMLYAGLRDSEALALNVGRDVDFENKVIHVRYFRHVDGNRVWVNQEGKTPAAIRDVPLFPQLEEVLKGIPGLLIDMNGEVLTTSGWLNAWNVYVNNLEVALNGCRKRWYGKRDCDKLNPPPDWRPVTIRPYDLRHSYCTWCRDAGVDPHVLQVWMGHSDISMIMKIYDHVSDDRITEETEKIVKLTATPSKSPADPQEKSLYPLICKCSG